MCMVVRQGRWRSLSTTDLEKSYFGALAVVHYCHGLAVDAHLVAIG